MKDRQRAERAGRYALRRQRVGHRHRRHQGAEPRGEHRDQHDDRSRRSDPQRTWDASDQVPHALARMSPAWGGDAMSGANALRGAQNDGRHEPKTGWTVLAGTASRTEVRGRGGAARVHRYTRARLAPASARSAAGCARRWPTAATDADARAGPRTSPGHGAIAPDPPGRRAVYSNTRHVPRCCDGDGLPQPKTAV